MRISDWSSDVCSSDLFAFDDRTSIPSEEVDDWLAGRAAGNAYLDRLEPAISFAQYAAAFHHVKEAITAGGIYQAHLPFPPRARWRGDPIAPSRTIRPDANARIAELLVDGCGRQPDLSPPLFLSPKARR